MALSVNYIYCLPLITDILGPLNEDQACPLCINDSFKPNPEVDRLMFITHDISFAYRVKRDEMIRKNIKLPISMKIKWWSHALEEMKDILDMENLTIRQIHEHLVIHQTLGVPPSPKIPVAPWDYHGPCTLSYV